MSDYRQELNTLVATHFFGYEPRMCPATPDTQWQWIDWDNNGRWCEWCHAHAYHSDGDELEHQVIPPEWYLTWKGAQQLFGQVLAEWLEREQQHFLELLGGSGEIRCASGVYEYVEMPLLSLETLARLQLENIFLVALCIKEHIDIHTSARIVLAMYEEEKS